MFPVRITALLPAQVPVIPRVQDPVQARVRILVLSPSAGPSASQNSPSDGPVLSASLVDLVRSRCNPKRFSQRGAKLSSQLSQLVAERDLDASPVGPQVPDQSRSPGEIPSSNPSSSQVLRRCYSSAD
jgi:hypothetical protein